MEADPGKAVQAEIISYLMAQTLAAPPVRREALFAAVKSALNLWIAGAKDMRTQAARNALEAGFGGVARAHLAELAHHSPRSPEWLKHFRVLKEDFEREAHIRSSALTMEKQA